MIFWRSGISGMSGSFRREGFECGFWEAVEHSADIGLIEHRSEHGFLGHLLLLVKRRLAALVGEADGPDQAGGRLGLGRKVAGEIGSKRSQRAEHQLPVSERHKPDMVAKGLAEAVPSRLLKA